MTASEHWRTPTLSVSDGRGLPVRQVAYLRTVAQTTPLVNRQQHDAVGRLVAQWDPRLLVPCQTTVYALSGAALKSDSVDAGWRLNLPGLAGEPRKRWDERDHQWLTAFDNQLRVVAIEQNGEVEAFTYADASADAGHNLRGQLLAHKDNGGTLHTDSFALSGQPMQETRTFGDGEAFTSQRVFSPLGAVLEQTDAGDHRQQSRYGLAGQLKQVQLLINGQPDWQPVLLDAQYNAADQIIEQQAGNGVLSQWTYDPADGRLHTQRSRKAAGAVLQDFEYFYDPVGNITRIEDHAFQPVWFANQLIEGHRDFCYDSLYRLTCATGYDDGPLSDIPGLPQPTDPNNRLNYTQTYEYDPGGNLIKLCHVRAGANHTVQMCIDSTSNRGVRWKPGDPPPDFDKLFDRHGNLQTLATGDMQWNVRDELACVTLIHREDARDDAEHYHYSQGVRVFKRHETFTDTAEHFHQVRYLPGLEIRTKDNGEVLHVISVGNVRCLHWTKNPPPGAENNQRRYSLDDHLGSCVMELDQNAQVISHEGYYPFGATAWMATRSAIEVSYKFIRYSGKEMDASGFYYYGARYYAPWVQRWISADPAGDVQGLNLYTFVSNNPMIYVDPDGQKGFDFNRIASLFRTTASVANQVHDTADRFDGPDDEADVSQEIRDNMTFRRFLFSKKGMGAFSLGFTVGGVVGGVAGSFAPVIGNTIGGFIGGLVGGLGAAYVRYRFFKRGIRVTETLHTADIRDAIQAVAEGANDVANGTIPQIIQDNLNQIRQSATEALLEKVKEMSPLDQLEFTEMVEAGHSIADAYRSVSGLAAAASRGIQDGLEAVQEIHDNLSEAEQANHRLQAMMDNIAAQPMAQPMTRPVPKPRTKFIRRASVGETVV
ncbi:RHS repeat-associated core domain-containing protein [Pseudomonas sp. RA_105y_Pfl2_P56]|uniref:RHS repeat-associated core domain-containing protein n=2 Tax=Pseudomonas TaxID=286 RepID=UPI0030DA1F84